MHEHQLEALKRQMAEALEAEQFREAEGVAQRLLEWDPTLVPALVATARSAVARGNWTLAAAQWQRASEAAPADEVLAFQAATALMQTGDIAGSIERIQARLQARGRMGPANWLALGHLRRRQGDAQGALRAWFKATRDAHLQGRWRDEASTEPSLRSWVAQAHAEVGAGRPAIFRQALDRAREDVGRSDLVRVERALAAYLGETKERPTDPRQRPKFMYIPGLRDLPYWDPAAQPWRDRLVDAYPDIRDEALSVLNAGGDAFQSFLQFPAGARSSDYLGGQALQPSWDAFFFYRHGERFDANHAQCPRTSAALESIELCRIGSQAPEVCFSLLAPQSHIKPHFGVSNMRLVFHLPLLVPPGCALHVLEAGEHAWREGQPMMFDDTFQHEAWNRSDHPRLILLMDCWHPDLSPVERHALVTLVEAITDFELAR